MHVISLTACLLFSSFGLYSDANVRLELVTQRGFQPADSHRWLRMLEKVGADQVTIRAARNGDAIDIQQLGTERRPSYKVIGKLTADNRLQVPGRTFRLSDQAKISEWIKRLKTEGARSLTEEKHAFGLNAEQLVALHEDLARPFRQTTRGKPVSEVVQHVLSSLATPVHLDQSARRALAGRETVFEELKGMSRGTVLTGIIRPLGLVVSPRQQNGRNVQLVLLDSRMVEEHWPVGWPLEKPPFQAAPSLFTDLDGIEIDDYPLSDTLAVLEQKSGVPILYDHNSMARHGAEISSMKVSLQAGKMSYIRVIKRLLAQTKPQLKYELRVDEAGKPFIWMTTVKR